MKRSFQHQVKNLFLLFLSILLCMLLGEAVLRIFFKENIVLFPRYHTSASYENFIIRKNIPRLDYYHTSCEGKWHFITNQRGFRNTENYDYPKTPNTIRVLSIGDSHTFGYEVDQDETYSSQIAKNLSSNSIRAQVMNAGVSGFGTAEELIFLENEGIKYKPDYVILGFFKNDFDDNVRANLFSLQKDSLFLKNNSYLPGVKVQDFIYRFGFIKWLSENSYLYSFIFNSIWDFYKGMSIEDAHSYSKEYAINTKQKVDEYPKRLTVKLLERIYSTCRKSGIQFILVDIPSWEFNGKIESSFNDISGELKEPICDYLIKYEYVKQNLTQGEILRRKGHHHISAKTHKFIADLCANYIKSQNITHFR
jgi:hypothetical protein